MIRASTIPVTDLNLPRDGPFFHRDDGPSDNMVVLPCLKSMTWVMENKNSPANRVVCNQFEGTNSLPLTSFHYYSIGIMTINLCFNCIAIVDAYLVLLILFLIPNCKIIARTLQRIEVKFQLFKTHWEPMLLL
ncbi:hypothetical protein IFM89_013870 [Coptis chinensis]|uniref:Uncharacterized protein n=1 Tax=Coptis chinensis TaxID=261450 RepID=A0A835HEJ1_9MAGN|nr:hypothetical protein IFM89_013870 [Coptis chinensis]